VCVEDKKKRNNHLTDDGWLWVLRSPAVCCSIASEGIQQYNTHGQIFSPLRSKLKGTGPRCRCSFSENSTRRQTIGRWVVAGECWNFFVINGFFHIILSVFVLCKIDRGKNRSNVKWFGTESQQPNHPLFFLSFFLFHMAASRSFCVSFLLFLFSFGWWLWNSFGLLEKVNGAVCACVSCARERALKHQGGGVVVIQTSRH